MVGALVENESLTTSQLCCEDQPGREKLGFADSEILTDSKDQINSSKVSTKE